MSTAGPAAPGVEGLFDRLRERVTAALTDATRNNPLLYYKDNRTTRFTVPGLDSPFVTKLLAKSLVRRPEFAEPDHGDPAVDPLMRRLRAIKLKAREFEEERGLRTLFVALGMVSWPAADGGREHLAPLFLVPVRVVEDPQVRGDLAVMRSNGDELVVNRALLSLAPPELAARIEDVLDDEGADDARATIRKLEPLLATIAGVRVQDRCAIGIFNFAYMAMIEDLHLAGEAMEAHPVVRALAGDAAAQAALSAQRDGSVVDVDQLDRIPPAEELFVLDADPWQSQAVHTIANSPDAHAVIDGPPGTGKSQTIANLIATLVGQGQSVLFVAEKRAALDVVRRRLTEAGLGALVLDLHGADVTRRQTYKQLKTALAQVSAAMPAPDAYDQPLEDRRATLNAHCNLMHGPLPQCGLSPYQLLDGLARLAVPDVRARFRDAALAALTPGIVRETRGLLDEAALNSAVFLRSTDVPWSRSTLRAAEVPAAVDRLGELHDTVFVPLRAALRSLGFAPASLAQFREEAARLASVANACSALDSAVLDDDAALTAAWAALSSPLGRFLAVFSRSRRRRYDALMLLRSLPPEWHAAVRSVAALPVPAVAAAAALPRAIAEVQQLAGFPLPDDLDTAIETVHAHAEDPNGAYRAARMREIEHALIERGLGPFLGELASRAAPAAAWADSFERAWLQSHIDTVRRDFAAFNGRLHDRVVDEFRDVERELRRVSARRILRAAAQRRADRAREFPAEDAAVRTQLEKIRPRKSFRDLFEEAPHALSTLAPCVMASPLSISQFLPRQTLFDVVVFDEASQVTPESAVTAILRGKRLVVAGDDKQLPPTDFFKAALVEDDADEETDEDTPIEGVESVLGAVRPFAKPLGLRVHYRSRDERLIAFSNHYLYGDSLVTFAGSGADDPGVRHVLVPPSGAETDEVSSAPEVRRVVELILEHAERRPHESLGVIALGIEHARRLDAALDLARRERPDLDDFFSEHRPEPFFVKNLERVQGDERDAVILTLGYGRTKSGAVSHNFGPINREGGERRLNVAITRAKTRVTLVSSFRKADLDPNSLRKLGPQLLAAYLGYCESGGRDLGRDVAHPEIPLNAFEADIMTTLERRLGLAIVPQHGVSQYRIDLAVQHPDQPGRFVLAIECDGASYHSTPTARMRDRLRQQILENLGWHFCRIWSTDWFNDREGEAARVERAYHAALALTTDVPSSAAPSPVVPPVPQQPPGPARSGPSPARPPYASIGDVSDGLLDRLVAWIDSDHLIRTDDEMLEAMMQELGFHRRGPRIIEHLTNAIRRARVPR